MTSFNEFLLTQAALDGELDAAGMLDFENRSAGNASLAAEYGRLKTLCEVMHRELVKPVAPRPLRVKPWFAARFALAPKVVDLAAQGFPLAGGRIDVIAGAPTPVLIYRHNEHFYRHNEHFISLTALPAEAAPSKSAFNADGYSVEVWRDSRTEYWAISDIDPVELSKFRQSFEAAAKAGSSSRLIPTAMRLPAALAIA